MSLTRRGPSWLSSFLINKGARILSLFVFFSGILWNIHQARRSWPNNSTRISSPISQSVKTLSSLPLPHNNSTKVALLIEDRPLPFLSPLILHFITVLPSDWTFHFIGSSSSIGLLTTRSRIIHHHIHNKKLSITPLPAGTSIASQELISQFMTTLWLWRDVLYPAETVLVFQSDSILCSKAHQSIDDFLHWDWIGAPWRDKKRIGGNGGFSLRKRGALVDILEKEERKEGEDFEDVWFTKRLRKAGRKIAQREEALKWSGESQVTEQVLEELDRYQNAKGRGKGRGRDSARDPRTKFEPMGYHIGNSGDQFHTNIWGTKELREHVYEYCPEIKMLLPMDAKEFVPGKCQEEWEWGKDPKLDHPEKFRGNKEAV